MWQGHGGRHLLKEHIEINRQRELISFIFFNWQPFLELPFSLIAQLHLPKIKRPPGA